MGISITADEIARSTWINLMRDFKLEKEFSTAYQALQVGDLKTFRKASESNLGLIRPNRFKKMKQLENLLKKYRFEHDVMSNDELNQVTLRGYLDTQLRLSEFAWSPRPIWVQAVVSGARKIARQILGDFTEDDINNCMRFGKKASIGCPYSFAYIDHKLTDEGALTSSSCGKDWFTRYRQSDDVLSRILKKRQPIEVTNLTLQLVPKTWKTHRVITPLPLIDLAYTFGVGTLVEQRLAEHGLDLRRLPERHRRLVARNSEPGYLATADLSSASDSLTSSLLNMVLPRKWFNALKRAFFRTVSYEGTMFHTWSVLPMGNGFTFPVETLIFYCLLRSIQNLTHVKGLVSVFGDDLIYPVRMHRFIAAIFPGLGLKLNLDKTFASFPFRESCGEDYYRGFPVRSAYIKAPESYKPLKGYAFTSTVYKIVNVLLRRWSYHEVRFTIDWLLGLINLNGYEIMRVPPLFPDQSGLKVEHPTERYGPLCTYAPVHVRFSHGTRWFEFQFLELEYKDRVVIAQEPYYWLALKGDSDEVEGHWAEWSMFQSAPRQPLRWRKIQRKIRKSCLDASKIYRLIVKNKYIPLVTSRTLRKIVVRRSGPVSTQDSVSCTAWN